MCLLSDWLYQGHSSGLAFRGRVLRLGMFLFAGILALKAVSISQVSDLFMP